MKNLLKRFIFWLVIVLSLEFSFGLLMFDSYLKTSIINITLYSIIISLVLSLLTGIFKGKIHNIICYIFLGILWLLYSTQFIFYQTLKSYFSFSVLGIGDQLKSFVGETFKAIFAGWYGLIIFAIPLILFIIFKKKINLKSNKMISYLTYSGMIILFVGLYILNITLQSKIDMSIYSLYFKVNDNALNIEKTGVLSAYNLDLYRTIFGFKEKYIPVKESNNIDDSPIEYDANALNLDFSKKTNNNEQALINNYMKNDVASIKNKYTGLFEGYNLVYFTAESFSEIGISEELTPTLYKLVNSGFKFNNFYTPNNLSTIGGEFQSMTSLFADNSILTKWRSGSNYFPYGLGTVFSSKGYDTYAFHDNWYQFQDRDKYTKTQGFTNYTACFNGLEKVMNCDSWPESDEEMIKGTISKYINSDKPFMTYYMTVSGHYGYTFSGNSMALKNKKYVNNLPYNENIKAYIATQIELDHALEYLIDELEKVNKLDNTVFVLLADHYPYNLSLDNINEISSFNRDSVVGVNHNALIIWNNRLKKMSVNKTCMSIDVLPTVLNLFNIEYDSRLLIGNDIFSTKPGLAFFTNHSWVSDNGTYYANSNKFIEKNEVEDNYIKTVNDIVSNRINMSRLIVKSNYYNYLLK